MKYTVAELLEKMTPSEFALWVAVDKREPIGGRRSDIQTGIVASTMANIHRSKNSRPFSPADFMPFQKTPVITEDEIALKVETFLSRY